MRFKLLNCFGFETALCGTMLSFGKTQMRNTHLNVFLEYDGEKLCIAEWAEKLKVKYARLYSFVRRYGNDISAMTTRLKLFIEKQKGENSNED